MELNTVEKTLLKYLHRGYHADRYNDYTPYVSRMIAFLKSYLNTDIVGNVKKMLDKFEDQGLISRVKVNGDDVFTVHATFEDFE